MGAPLPKSPGQRRRRHAGQAQWQQLPASGREDNAPGLPDGEWSDDVVRWWEALWRSPMAVAYQDADFDSLVRLARLKEQFARDPRPSTALPAMQQLEDRFGLSPKARRALQWEIAAEQERDEEDFGEAVPLRVVRDA